MDRLAAVRGGVVSVVPREPQHAPPLTARSKKKKKRKREPREARE